MFARPSALFSGAQMRSLIFSAAFVFVFSSVTACSMAGANPDGGGQGGGQSPSGNEGGGAEMVTRDDAGVLSSAPELVTVQAQVSSRSGRDLRITVKGKDRDLDVTGLWVRLLDSQGMAVIGIDTNGDASPDVGEGPVPLASSKWVGETLSADATVRGVFAAGQAVTQVSVALVDGKGKRSAEKTVSVSPQPQRALGDPCDALYVADRCAPGLGCRGMPAVCQEGLAPEVARFAFYRAAGGPVILIEGTEPEDDLGTILFEFENASGQPISVDSDGDGIPDLSSFPFDAKAASVDGAFFIQMQAGQGLDTQLAKLVATPSDIAGHVGTAKKAAPAVPPVRTQGQSCDPRGFDVCGANLVCSPGLVSRANTCVGAANLRTARCQASPVLVATAAGAVISGRAEGASLWDTPAGCSTNDPKGRPEGVVMVRLAQRANRLTLSTALPGTTFDTTLYVLPGCPSASVDAYACVDDAAGQQGASEVVLTDLPAGDYLVVVDSFDTAGGSFELKATVE